MASHKDTRPCPLCEQKLSQAHPELQEWFHDCVLRHYPDAHIAWAYRDQKQQDACNQSGASSVKFPNSQHNRIPAMALDIFFLRDKKAVFCEDDYRALWAASLAENWPVRWGGNFKRYDGPHFELKGVT